jgi:hypothetical protein
MSIVRERMGRNVPARGESPGSVRNSLDLEVVSKGLTLRSWEWAFFSFSHLDSTRQLHFFQLLLRFLRRFEVRLTGGYPVTRGPVMRLRRIRQCLRSPQSARVFLLQ